MSKAGGTRAVIAALLANLGIAVSEIIAFAFTGSSSTAGGDYFGVA